MILKKIYCTGHGLIILIILGFLNGMAFSSVNVSIPDRSGNQGSTIDIPIQVSDVTGEWIYSVGIKLEFDTSVLEAKEVKISESLLEAWGSPTVNIQPGQIAIGAAGANPLSGSGTLIFITFEVKGTAGSSTNIHFADIVFNEGNPTATTDDGYFSVIEISDVINSVISRGYRIAYPTLVETPDGTLHCAYAEGQELKYAISNDSGITWTIHTIPTPTAYAYGSAEFSGIFHCQLAIDSNGSVYILYNINTMQFSGGIKFDIYCSTNVSGNWQFELVKEAWHYYSSYYGYAEYYRPRHIIIDSKNKIHLFARKDGWWRYGMPLHEIVRKSDGTWNDVIVVHIQTSHPDGVSMLNPRASIDSKGKISVTFVNPGTFQSSTVHDLHLIEGDTNQSWGTYVTKNNDAKYAASVIDAQDNIHVIYVAKDNSSLKYMKNWVGIEIITTVQPPLAIRDLDIHVDGYSNLTIMARTYDRDTDVTTDVWFANKSADGDWSGPQELSTDFEPSKFDVHQEKPLINGSMSGVYTLPKIVCVYKIDDETSALIFMELDKSGPTQVSKHDMSLSDKSFALFHNYPNPFNPETKISYVIPEQSHVILEIYNIAGEKVKTLFSGQKNAGYHSVNWDGRDNLGRLVSGGIYLCRIKAGSYQQTIRMLLMK